MPPLTLEQVLARSMRLPRRSVAKATGYGAVGGPMGLPHGVGVAKSSPKEEGVSSLFALLEKRDGEMAAGRPSIHQSNNLIRNSQDLLAYLQAAKRMHAWEDALRYFSEVTKSLIVRWSGERGSTVITLQQEAGTSPNDRGCRGVTANVAHITVLLDTCANAKQWHLVEQLGEAFRDHTPKALIDAVSLLANSCRGDATDGLYGWKRAIQFLQLRIPPEEQPVEAYNACLTACEKTLDWEGALAIVRAMGPNPLQQMDCGTLPSSSIPLPPDGEVAPLGSETSGASGATQDDVHSSMLQPPQPNVVTYATLLSVLDQCGKEKFACEVLQRLPALEKEEITAAYAALIHVWSEQKYRQRRRFF
uniref:Uncharacterized protein TCIL3000_10_11700 n=1 Tax=Trypanosoma congolense (strain IL3000) TaxID=1068625 RepID=G0UYC2_TRYCI|nr:unnamed protein product [Trypanosoma congolense IL3000]